MGEEAPNTIQVHTKAAGPIVELPRLVQSLLFAELAAASYFDETHALKVVQQIGFAGCQYFDRDGAQAYIFWNDVDCVVACRGTEPNRMERYSGGRQRRRCVNRNLRHGAQGIQRGGRRLVAAA